MSPNVVNHPDMFGVRIARESTIIDPAKHHRQIRGRPKYRGRNGLIVESVFSMAIDADGRQIRDPPASNFQQCQR